VKRRPQGVGPAITLVVLIEGVQHNVDVNPLRWTTTLLLSPADIQQYWILGDTTLSVLGTTTRLAAF
jgi:hypothetical protein